MLVEGPMFCRVGEAEEEGEEVRGPNDDALL